MIGSQPANALRRLHPFAVFFDQIDQAVERFFGGDVILYALFAYVEIDLRGRAADVAEVGVGHFTGAVDDAAHDRDRHTFEVIGA